MSTFRGLTVHSISKTVEEGINNLQISAHPRQEKLPAKSIRVSVKAVGLNFFDLLLLVGRYQHKPKLPFIIGSECSGVVSECGSGVTRFKIGDEVMIGMSQFCGGEELVCSEMIAFPKPSVFSHEEASAFFVGFSTAYHGLIQRGKLQSGEFVLITGASGGMGLAAIQLAKVVGAKIIAFVSTKSKKSVCTVAGADFVLCPEDQGWKGLKDEVGKITHGKGVDVIYDLVGGPIFDECVRCITVAGGGRLCVVGFASGTIPKLPINLALVKGFDLVGVRAGEQMRRNPSLVLEMLQSIAKWDKSGDLKKLAPVIGKVVTCDDFRDGFEEINNRKIVGKVVVKWSPQSKL